MPPLRRSRKGQRCGREQVKKKKKRGGNLAQSTKQFPKGGAKCRGGLPRKNVFTIMGTKPANRIDKGTYAAYGQLKRHVFSNCLKMPPTKLRKKKGQDGQGGYEQRKPGKGASKHVQKNHYNPKKGKEKHGPKICAHRRGVSRAWDGWGGRGGRETVTGNPPLLKSPRLRGQNRAYEKPAG